MILVGPSWRWGDHMVKPERKPPLRNLSLQSASETSQLETVSESRYFKNMERVRYVVYSSNVFTIGSSPAPIMVDTNVPGNRG